MGVGLSGDPGPQASVCHNNTQVCAMFAQLSLRRRLLQCMNDTAPFLLLQREKPLDFRQVMGNAAPRVLLIMTFSDMKVTLTRLICLCFAWSEEWKTSKHRLTLEEEMVGYETKCGGESPGNLGSTSLLLCSELVYSKQIIGVSLRIPTQNAND